MLCLRGLSADGRRPFLDRLSGLEAGYWALVNECR